ncbi:Starch-binding associating with outer membrane [Myroides sp. A21]|uniref:RagB/SusD family nutrient uptake outer membrane protein n=1 Tax=Myroides sp. A21 TaxID=1583100 RepID=UPI0005861187|nr:RagB/SusD family nutrient uptake outer membrane protein [Myroides sp. A21]AJA67379.1 Starch-binding associating with outer membrane [Myroides sp. A21]
MKTTKKNTSIRATILVSMAIFLLASTLTSCESMIEVDSPTNMVNKEDVYKDIATTKSALAYLYSNIRANSFLSKKPTGLHHGLSLYTDELEHIGTTDNNYFLNTIQASGSETAQWWNNAYQDIYAINAFIEGLSQSSYIEQEIKKTLLGEAYTLRALYFQNLVQLYGDIPYTTSTDFKSNTTISKKPYQLVLIDIEQDLLKAIEYLKYSFRSPDKYYVNKAVAELLLSENYLLQKKYDLAELYSKNVIDSNLYHIEEDLTKTFKKDAKSTIWQISPEQGSYITPEASNYIFTTIAANTSVISDKLLNSFDTSDLRKQYWLKEIEVNGQVFYGVYKYKNKTNNTDENSIFFRIEHVYSILAESLLNQNKLSQATQIINKIRTKRGLLPLDTNIAKQELEQNFLQEMYKEFFAENGHRFFTLKRLNQLGQIKEIKTNWKDYNNLFPIPEKQLLINTNLNPQNNGY